MARFVGQHSQGRLATRAGRLAFRGTFGVTGDVWRYMGTFGVTGGRLALRGDVWRYGGTFGATEKDVWHYRKDVWHYR